MIISVARAVPNPAVRGTLRAQVRYHFPAVTEVSFTADTVDVEVPDGAGAGRGGAAGTELTRRDVADLVNEVVNAFAALPVVPTRVYYDSADPPAYERESHHDASAFTAAARQLAAELDDELSLRPRRAVAAPIDPAGRGLNRYGHELAALSRGIDGFIRRYYQRACGAQEIRVPSMLPTAVVDRAGYFDTARQHLSFVSPLDPARDRFTRFLPYWKAHSDGGVCHDGGLRDFLSVPGDVLNPALCLHCYPLVADSVIPAGEPVVFTLGGSCFRDESGNLNHHNRLREFAMREAVFIGDPAALDLAHPPMVDFVVAVARLFGLDCRLESATDIFFNDGAPQRMFSQLLSDNKIELIVRGLPDGAPMAAASVNKHQTHFTVPFGAMTDGGLPAVSLCVGFGIDRLALAIVRRARERDADALRMLLDSITEHLSARAGTA